MLCDVLNMHVLPVEFCQKYLQYIYILHTKYYKVLVILKYGSIMCDTMHIYRLQTYCTVYTESSLHALVNCTYMYKELFLVMCVHLV